MIVLDASIMIAVLDSADAHHSRAIALLAENTDQRLLAHRLALAETLVHPYRRNRGPEAAAVLASLGIEAREEFDDERALAELRASTGLRMPDCCVLHAAISHRAALATFDERLAATARERGLPLAF